MRPRAPRIIRAVLAKPVAREEAGSIAILALWGVALIFMLIAPVAFATRGELQIARNALAESRARHAAEGGVQYGLDRLLRLRASPAAFDGTPEAWRFGTAPVAVAIADEAGKIDLNAAPPEMLAGLFTGAGAAREAAELIACNIVLWRGDSGGICPQPGEPRPPRRFSVPEQLAEIPGVGERLYGRVAGSVTVATGAAAIDPFVAPRGVLMAIPGATDSMVDDFIANRAGMRDLTAGGAGLVPAAAMQFVIASPRRDFTIAATATTDDGARYRAEMLIRLVEQGARPYRVMGWRTPPADRGATAPRRARAAP
jgi:general secretion pathway protein K